MLGSKIKGNEISAISVNFKRPEPWLASLKFAVLASLIKASDFINKI